MTYKLAFFVHATILFALSLLNAQNVQSIDFWQVDSLIVIDSTYSRYIFPERHHLAPHTLTIQLNNELLSETLDYRLEGRQAIHFFRKFHKGDSLRIRYRRLPLQLPRVFRLFKLDTSKEARGSELSRGGPRLQAVKFQNPFTQIPSTLQASGSIMRGIKIGTNQDFSLNSGLNLQLSGQLSDDIEIVAALTDEATPIQPEGNTQTLEEIDKVFVQFKSPLLQGTVGDFNLNYRGSRFGSIQRKLQGITLQTRFKNHTFGATVAATRGFFHHVSFLGQEGNQGPYQLTGKNGEREIIVLAGTERVYVDGERMVRGEDNDYVIEYGNGQIRFTNQRLITSESRIEVDFEYFPAVQSYNRNVYQAVSRHQLFNGRWQLDLQFYREADNTKEVLQEGQALSAEQKKLLRQAGDDALKAVEPGYTFKGDSGGNYIKIDTLYNGATYTVFKYIGSKQGNYSVTFSFVGRGKGDYVRERLGRYRWVGPAKGEYLPVRFLALPSKHDLLNLHLAGQVWKQLSLEMEYAFSNFDANTFSPLNDNDNKGQAVALSSTLKEQKLQLGKRNLGIVSMNLKTRFIQSTFRSADRFQKPDFQRYWNLYALSADNPQENSVQFDVRYQLPDYLVLNGNLGQFTRPEFASYRSAWQLQFDRSSLFKSKSYFEQIRTENQSQNLNDSWKRYGLTFERKLWKFIPQIEYSGEWRKQDSNIGISGFRFDQYGLGLQSRAFKHLQAGFNARQRDDYVYDPQNPGELVKQARSRTYQFQLQLQNFRTTHLQLNFLQRSKDYTPRFENIRLDTLIQRFFDPAVQDTSWRDRSTSLAQIELTHRNFKNALNISWQYRLSTEETALKEKVYVDVGEGRGNLRYDPLLKEYVPDPLGNYILYILPSGKFEPVSNVQTAFRLRFDPYRLMKSRRQKKHPWYTKLSGETYVRVEEQTRDPQKLAVFTLQPSHLQGKYTVRGVFNVQQDLYFMRHNRKLSFRLRYRLTSNYNNQYLDANENDRRRNQEMGIRMDWRPKIRFRSQTETRWRTFSRNSTSNPLRNRDILGYYLIQNFSFQPKARWEIGFGSESGYETNSTPLYPMKLWFTIFKQRLNYALPSKGRATFEYQLQNVSLLHNPLQLVVPFEMAQGKRKGLSQSWQLRIEYTVSKNILFTFQYIGRKDAGFKRTIHTGQAELRAYL